MKNHMLYKFSIAVYIIAAIVCYGPAAEEGERASYTEWRECLARQKADSEIFCGNYHYDMSAFSATFQSAFWPMWLSYRIAGGPVVLQEQKGGE